MQLTLRSPESDHGRRKARGNDQAKAKEVGVVSEIEL